MTNTKQKLSDTGFTLIGEYVPFVENTVIIVTNENALSDYDAFEELIEDYK